MVDKFLRIKVNEELIKKFRIYCIENNISLPKQISALIKIFVELREEDQKNRK